MSSLWSLLITFGVLHAYCNIVYIYIIYIYILYENLFVSSACCFIDRSQQSKELCELSGDALLVSGFVGASHAEHVGSYVAACG